MFVRKDYEARGEGRMREGEKENLRRYSVSEGEDIAYSLSHVSLAYNLKESFLPCNSHP